MTYSDPSRYAFDALAEHGRRHRPPTMNANWRRPRRLCDCDPLVSARFRAAPATSTGAAKVACWPQFHPPLRSSVAKRRSWRRVQRKDVCRIVDRSSFLTRATQWIRSAVEGLVNFSLLGSSCREGRAIIRLISVLFSKKPFAASNRTRSSISSAALRVAGVSLGALAWRRSNPQTAHWCCGTSPR